MKTRRYTKRNHIRNLVSSEYYSNLILLRNIVGMACDEYFQDLNAPRIDLFLITKEVSSPVGRGSDSLPIPIPFGKTKTFLTDSAQFGMEPIVQKKFRMVYCYLPSFRGEEPDERHLNQFYHCEAELRGGYSEAMSVAEELVKHIMHKTFEAYSSRSVHFSKHNFEDFPSIIRKKFPVLTFDEAASLLAKKGFGSMIRKKKFGRVMTSAAEKKLTELLSNNRLPVWVTKYDRDTVPFYQAPDPVNPERVLNADLLFPSIHGGYGGEIVGSGQRQKKIRDIVTSMKRQKVVGTSGYKWYIDLRKRKDYQTTSGFGLGIERFLAWMLRQPAIADVCVYPIIKTEF